MLSSKSGFETEFLRRVIAWKNAPNTRKSSGQGGSAYLVRNSRPFFKCFFCVFCFLRGEQLELGRSILRCITHSSSTRPPSEINLITGIRHPVKTSISLQNRRKHPLAQSVIQGRKKCSTGLKNVSLKFKKNTTFECVKKEALLLTYF